MFKKLLPFLIIAAAIIPSFSFAATYTYTWNSGLNGWNVPANFTFNGGQEYFFYCPSPSTGSPTELASYDTTPSFRGYEPISAVAGQADWYKIIPGSTYQVGLYAFFYSSGTTKTFCGGTQSNVVVYDSSPFVCSPTSVSNGSVAAYPDCAITCDNGYNLQGQTCVANPSVGMVISMPSNASSYFTGQVSRILADVGLLGVIGFAAAIPLLFWLIRAIIGLFVEIAGERKAAREYAEWEKEHNA